MEYQELAQRWLDFEKEVWLSFEMKWYEVKPMQKYSPVDFEMSKNGKSYWCEVKRRNWNFSDRKKFWLPLIKFQQLLNLIKLHDYENVFIIIWFNDCTKFLNITKPFSKLSYEVQGWTLSYNNNTLEDFSLIPTD